MPRLVGVVGAKHSGKTTVIEHLIVELKSRGHHVGVIKEMVKIPTLDTPQKETDRYAKAGAETIAAIPRDETVLFIKKRLTIKEIMPYLKDQAYVLVEGFESEKALPKIVTAKTAEEAQSYVDDSTIAISGVILDSETETAKASGLGIVLLNVLTQTKKLADLIEEKAVEA